MVKAPPSLASIQALGAARRFRCFLGPRGIVTLSSEKITASLVLTKYKIQFRHSKLSP